MITETMLDENLAGTLFIEDDKRGTRYLTYGGVEFETVGKRNKYSFINRHSKYLKVVVIDRYAEFETDKPVVTTGVNYVK